MDTASLVNSLVVKSGARCVAAAAAADTPEARVTGDLADRATALARPALRAPRRLSALRDCETRARARRRAGYTRAGKAGKR